MDKLEEGFILSFIHEDIYRNNPFRVLSLSTNATTREIKRRAEEIRLEGRLSKLGEGDGVLAPLLPSSSEGDDSDEDSNPARLSRKASKQLLDPLERLIYEIFWLWPAENENAGKENLRQIISNEEFSRAKVIWEVFFEENQDDFIAQHNLAVLNHMYALEIGRQAQDYQKPQGSTLELDGYWTNAFVYWSGHVESTGFIEYLDRRVETLDDPRIDTNSISQIIEGLPIAILTLLVAQIPSAIQAGKHTCAQSYARLFEESPFSEYTKTQARRVIAEPIRQRVADSCERAEKEGKSDRRRAIRWRKHF